MNVMNWNNPFYTSTTSTQIYLFDTATTASTSTIGIYTQYSSGSDLNIWRGWVSSTNTYMPQLEVQQHEPEPLVARRIDRAQVARHQVEERERMNRRREAEVRAEQLLLEVLNPAQREEYRRDKCVVIHGRNARYRVGRVGTIDVIDRDGAVSHRLCVHPNAYVPLGDYWAAQVLGLKTDEERFVRIANRHAAMNRGEMVLPPLPAQ